jgi:hypothetical protein
MGHDFSGPIPIGHTLSFPDKNPFSFCKWLSNGLGIGLARNGKRIRGDGGPPNTIRISAFVTTVTASSGSASDEYRDPPVCSSAHRPCAQEPRRRCRPPPRPPPLSRFASCCAFARSSRRRPRLPARHASPSSVATPAARPPSSSKTSTPGAPPQ